MCCGRRRVGGWPVGPPGGAPGYADGYGTGGIQEERTVLDPSSSVSTCLDDNL
jgi:hypothetical protein